jgi:hypothetical protein
MPFGLTKHGQRFREVLCICFQVEVYVSHLKNELVLWFVAIIILTHKTRILIVTLNTEVLMPYLPRTDPV